MNGLQWRHEEVEGMSAGGDREYGVQSWGACHCSHQRPCSDTQRMFGGVRRVTTGAVPCPLYNEVSSGGSGVGWGHHTHHTTPHQTTPHRTAPHRTAPHQTKPNHTRIQFCGWEWNAPYCIQLRDLLLLIEIICMCCGAIGRPLLRPLPCRC